MLQWFDVERAFRLRVSVLAETCRVAENEADRELKLLVFYLRSKNFEVEVISQRMDNELTNEELRGQYDELLEEHRALEELLTIREGEMDWIKVKDRLPEVGKSVLVFWDHVDSMKVGKLTGPNGPWAVGLTLVQGIVTHWMPLPGPPK